ncbi:MAG TPA: GNAT family N-acetyltransferase [Gaiellaceae bacterium]|nr:GNAT family N-acetyltransferase [Gaiellaceae bacterium]
MSAEVRPARDQEEFARAVGVIGQYFPADPEWPERFARLLPHERMHAAFADGEVVGGAGAFPFELSVPGGSRPCAGVTVVGVQPTHRRRGVLRAMMDAQLRDVHERGEPLAALWASEETIYGRFGYGISAWAGEVKIPHEWDAFAEPLERRGAVRLVSLETAAELFPPVYDVARRQRPGMPSRSREWWELRQLRAWGEDAGSPKRFAVLEAGGEPQAYAIYRVHMEFEEGSSAARLAVSEAVGATPQATAELWRFLLDVDWIGTVEAHLLPPDHPLFLLLANPRRARYRLGDGLWMRLVDVGAALSGRAYAGDGAVVFELRDGVCEWNDGRWRVEGGACERTDAEPDLALDASALGSAYLGAVSFQELRAALRLEELREGAVERADALFGWRPLPWCPEIF